jgi:hypothetical protein
VLEPIVELIAAVLVEVIFSVVGEIACELGLEALIASGREARTNAPLAAVGALLLGGIVGGISVLIFPSPFVKAPRIPGASLVLAPLIAGFAIHLFGRLRRRQGTTPTFLGTFAGGAVFAFAVALIRLVSLRGLV